MYIIIIIKVWCDKVLALTQQYEGVRAGQQYEGVRAGLASPLFALTPLFSASLSGPESFADVAMTITTVL